MVIPTWYQLNDNNDDVDLSMTRSGLGGRWSCRPWTTFRRPRLLDSTWDNHIYRHHWHHRCHRSQYSSTIIHQHDTTEWGGPLLRTEDHPFSESRPSPPSPISSPSPSSLSSPGRSTRDRRPSSQPSDCFPHIPIFLVKIIMMIMIKFPMAKNCDDVFYKESVMMIKVLWHSLRCCRI